MDLAKFFKLKSEHPELSPAQIAEMMSGKPAFNDKVTQAQLATIKRLISSGKLSNVDTSKLTKREASGLIGSAYKR